VFLEILLKITKILGLNYLFSFLKRYSEIFYSLLVILANLIPVYGVFYLDWEVFDIFFLYWLENGVIGFFNIIKMHYAQGQSDEDLVRPYMKYSMNPQVLSYKNSVKNSSSPLFFLVHYGSFFVIHGFFLMQLFKDSTLKILEDESEGVIIFLISLFVVYTFSLIFDYFGKEQYKHANRAILMFSPYLRVILIHMIILLGYGLVGERKLILIFIIFKIIAELFFYKKVILKWDLSESVS